MIIPDLSRFITIHEIVGIRRRAPDLRQLIQLHAEISNRSERTFLQPVVPHSNGRVVPLIYAIGNLLQIGARPPSAKNLYRYLESILFLRREQILPVFGAVRQGKDRIV